MRYGKREKRIQFPKVIGYYQFTADLDERNADDVHVFSRWENWFRRRMIKTKRVRATNDPHAVALYREGLSHHLKSTQMHEMKARNLTLADLGLKDTLRLSLT